MSHLRFVPTSHAPTPPVSEAADPITPNGATANPSPRQWTLSLQRWLTAAGSRCRALRDGAAKWCRSWSGDVEFTIGTRRGFLNGPCPICEADVHDEGVRCPRQLSASCSVCGPVLLTGAGNCPSGRRTHVISRSSIHPTTDAEWRRPRLIERNA